MYSDEVFQILFEVSLESFQCHNLHHKNLSQEIKATYIDTKPQYAHRAEESGMKPESTTSYS